MTDEEEIVKYRDIYVKAGYHVIFTSTKSGTGIEDVKRLLEGKTTAFAGPSGVGKSSLLNAIIPEANSETGAISEKIKRGKHTTRHSEIFNIGEDTFIFDTPGFSSLYVNDFEKEDLGYYFREFNRYTDKCRFTGCAHIGEPYCGVKKAVSDNQISRERYDNYLLLYEELKNKKKY